MTAPAQPTQPPVLPTPRPHRPRRVVDATATPWRDEYPFASHWLDVGSGGAAPLWLHYVDEGPKDAPAIVMVHGNPTWSFAFRRLIRALSTTHRCIVPDHVGMGLSDRPQGWTYRLGDHVDNLTKLVDHLGVTRCSLIVHDWGGAIGMGFATERPDALVSSFVMNTAAFLSQDIPPSIASVRIPVFGAFAVLRCNAFAGAATFRAVERRMAKATKQGYLAPYGTPHDRIATLRFVQDIPLRPQHPSYARLARIEERLPLLRGQPMQLAWGERDFCFTPKFRARWQALFPDAAVRTFPRAGHYVFEDEADAIVELARGFFRAALAAPPAIARDGAAQDGAA